MFIPVGRRKGNIFLAMCFMGVYSASMMRRTTPLAAARRHHLYSQEAIAQALGINLARYVRVEYGQRSPTPEEQSRLAAILKTPTYALFPELVSDQEVG